MHRRSLVLGVLLLSAALPVSSQTVYGLFGLPPTPVPGMRQIGTLDPTDGSVALIGSSTSIDTDTVTIGAGITAISVAGNALYFIGRDNGDSSSRIYTVDLDSGATTASFALSSFSFGETLGLWYDENTSTLWGLFTSGGDRALATVDPTDGTVGGTLYDELGGGNLSTAGGVFTGDSDGSRVFFIGTLEGEEAQMWEVSTTDGSVMPYPFEDWDEGTVQGIEWDALESRLWMIVHRGSGRQLAWYDFDEEAILLAEGEIDFGDPVSTSQGLITLDDATNQLFFIGRPDGGSWSIYTVDVDLDAIPGEATSTAIDGSSIQINGWAGFEIIPGPELSFSKDDGGDSAEPGDTVTWTLTASNAAGAGPAKGVVITDTVPEETTFSAAGSTAGWVCVPDASAGSVCNLSLPDIDPGSDGTADFAVVIDASVDPGLTELSNTASLSATNSTSEVEASDTTPVTAAAVLTLVKSDGDITTTPGSTVVYGISAGNTGNADALATTLSDTVPANTIFAAASSSVGWDCADGSAAGTPCSLDLGTLEGGDSANVNFAVTLAASVPAGTTAITNQAMLTSTNPASASASDTTPVTASPTLELTKSDGDADAVPGQIVAYSLGYANTGDEDAANGLLTETVPDQTTFNVAASTAGWVCVPDASAGSSCTLALGTVGGGDSGTATFAVTVDDPVLAGTTAISNEASFAADNALESAQGSDTTPVTAAPDLVLTKSDGDVGTVPGGAISYVLVFGNEGNENAADVVLTETVPANTTFVSSASTPGWVCTPDASAGSACEFDVGTLTGGDSSLVFFALVVDDPVTAGTTEISNTASIDGSNVEEPTTAEDVTPVTAEPSLSLTKDDGGVTGEPGDVIAYTLAFGNDGNEGAAEVTLTETIPANTTFDAANSSEGWDCVPDGSAGSVCTLDIGTVAGGGGSGNAVFAVRVDNPFPTDSNEVMNEASVSASNAGETVEASDATPIETVLDLAVDKNDGELPTRPGGTISYMISWDNVGNQSTSGVTITETVPGNTTFLPEESSGKWLCVPDNSAGSSCTLAVGDLASGADGSEVFAVIVDDPFTGKPAPIENTVSISDDGELGPDENPADNTDSTSTAIDGSPPVVVAIDSAPSVGGIESCSQLFDPVKQLVVELEDDFSGVADPELLAGYLVIAAGPDGDLDTTACGPVFGDDVEIPIELVSVTGDPTNPMATLTLAAEIPDGIALVLVCDSIEDVAGNALDGDSDGAAGGDFRRRFRVDVGNSFSNSNLDNCENAPIALAPWLDDSQPPNSVTATLETDVDESTLSGAFDIAGNDGQPISVAQCVPVVSGARWWAEASARIHATVADDLETTLWCAFSNHPECEINDPPIVIDNLTLASSLTPEWMAVGGRIDIPGNRSTALCGVEVATEFETVYRAYLDRLYFGDNSLFSDGFEKGDTSAWSAAVD